MDHLHIYAPHPTIFICGGKTNALLVGPTYLSLRDAFLRGAYAPPFDEFNLILAEEANLVFPTGRYQDFFQFEADIAQVVDLIVLFSESFGSATEMGAFAMLPEISKNMLVMIDNKNYNEMSYVALGPLKYLQDQYGDGATCVLNCEQLNIQNIEKLDRLDLNQLLRITRNAITSRLKSKRAPSTFDVGVRGHVIKLITGLIQHYGALTVDEIECYLSIFKGYPDQKTIRDFLLCAKSVGWILEDKRGINVFYSARNLAKSAISYKLRVSDPKLSKDRWQSDIRSFWKLQDQDRFEAITSALGR